MCIRGASRNNSKKGDARRLENIYSCALGVGFIGTNKECVPVSGFELGRGCASTRHLSCLFNLIYFRLIMLYIPFLTSDGKNIRRNKNITYTSSKNDFPDASHVKFVWMKKIQLKYKRILKTRFDTYNLHIRLHFNRFKFEYIMN